VSVVVEVILLSGNGPMTIDDHIFWIQEKQNFTNHIIKLINF